MRLGGGPNSANDTAPPGAHNEQALLKARGTLYTTEWRGVAHAGNPPRRLRSASSSSGPMSQSSRRVGRQTAGTAVAQVRDQGSTVREPDLPPWSLRERLRQAPVASAAARHQGRLRNRVAGAAGRLRERRAYKLTSQPGRRQRWIAATVQARDQGSTVREPDQPPWLLFNARRGAGRPSPPPAAPKLLVQLRAASTSGKGAGPSEPSRQPSSGCLRG